jgi:hypothetical protein
MAEVRGSLARQNLHEAITDLERGDLEGAELPYRPLDDYLTPAVALLRLKAMAAFWATPENRTEEDFALHSEDLVAGLFGQAVPFFALLLGRPGEVGMFYGLPNTGALRVADFGSVLRSTFPGVELSDALDGSRFTTLFRDFRYCAALTGVPTDKLRRSEAQAAGAGQVERLIRALYGERWAYLVVATPVPAAAIGGAIKDLTDCMRSVKLEHLRPGDIEEHTNPLFETYVKLMETALEQYKLGRLQGMWNVQTYLFTAASHVHQRGKVLLASIFGGERSLPHPTRVHDCVAQASLPHQAPVTVLTSRDLAVLVRPPREDMPGYTVRPYTRFAVSLPGRATEPTFPLGEILDRGTDTGNAFHLQVDELVKHGLIAGVTGSGKTNTCFGLLTALWQQWQLPFLVLEPAKQEYRYLKRAIPELQVFTLGDETVAPFRLNPFEMEAGIPVQTHIDYLKSVLMASFVLYAPMQYILDRALHEIYEDRGWNLALNQNWRGTGPRAFPTLTDLYYKVGQIVAQLGYDHEVSRNVKAGLETRINNLRIGGKGLMLDSRVSLPLDLLLQRPTVVELSRIGNDDDKAFLMGLLLTRIYEYHEGRGGVLRGGSLRHLTLIEEAHRLLQHVPTEVSEESSNIKGKAVAAFSNMLSEIRAYGEGILIAEQIPTKLAADAIKNSNLKVMHRILAQDDRDVLGGSMNLHGPQRDYGGLLRVGEALVFAEGMEAPCLVRIPAGKDRWLGADAGDATTFEHTIRTEWRQAYLPLVQEAAGMSGLDLPPEAWQRLRAPAQALAESPEGQRLVNRLLLTLVKGADAAAQALHAFSQWVATQAHHRRDLDPRQLLLGVALLAAEQAAEARGILYGWSFDDVEGFAQVQAKALTRVVHGDTAATDIAQFQAAFTRMHQRQTGPYPGCEACPEKCWYRCDTEALLEDERLSGAFIRVLRDVQPDDQMWHELARVCLDAAEQCVITDNQETHANVALCYASVQAKSLRLSPRYQARVATNVARIIRDK